MPSSTSQSHSRKAFQFPLRLLREIEQFLFVFLSSKLSLGVAGVGDLSLKPKPVASAT